MALRKIVEQGDELSLIHISGVLMFGYVRPSVRDLPEEELDRFRAMYCGL